MENKEFRRSARLVERRLPLNSGENMININNFFISVNKAGVVKIEVITPFDLFQLYKWLRSQKCGEEIQSDDRQIMLRLLLEALQQHDLFINEQNTFRQISIMYLEHFISDEGILQLREKSAVPGDVLWNWQSSTTIDKFLSKLREKVCILVPIFRSRHGINGTPPIHKDLTCCQFIFLRLDKRLPPLQLCCNDPVEFFKTLPKHLRLDIEGHVETISIDRLKSIHLDVVEPIRVAQHV
ncbi:hypothetical protein RF11_01400 [Thelohanellus kitauei]|uniref:Uncharacterized protein n=1 Tax=Thelohanellus kitauei TaxID=669202 RepID=A0A0C2N6C8_THEKT|nr:hypothetical protein RF11_01400 [Thelohanellus kitauei]